LFSQTNKVFTLIERDVNMINAKCGILYKAYRWLKWTQFGEVFRYVRHASYRRSIKSEVNFLKQFIHKNSIIFDVGANFGHKTLVFLKLDAKKIIAVEPDAECQFVLNQRFRGNEKVMVVNKAIDSHAGKANLYREADGSAFNTLSKKWSNSISTGSAGRFNSMKIKSTISVRTITLYELIQQFGLPDVVKLDIEGYELKAIQSLKSSIPLIWFEANLPEFQAETIQCIELIVSLDPSYRFNYCISTTESLGVKLEYKKWTDGTTMIILLKEKRYRFMEVFAQLS
jgi:FkbM family methyltransferase